MEGSRARQGTTSVACLRGVRLAQARLMQRNGLKFRRRFTYLYFKRQHTPSRWQGTLWLERQTLYTFRLAVAWVLAVCLGALCLASVVVTLDQSVEFDSTPIRVLTLSCQKQHRDIP